VRVVQRSGGRARTAVAPAKALGKGPRGCEFAGPDLATEITEQARRGACLLRSPMR